MLGQAFVKVNTHQGCCCLQCNVWTLLYSQTWNVLNCQATNAPASGFKSEDSTGLLLLAYTMFGRWSTPKTWNIKNCEAMNAPASQRKSEDSPGLLLLAYTMFGRWSTAKTWNVLNCQETNA